jgi:hypothetical protein
MFLLITKLCVNGGENYFYRLTLPMSSNQKFNSLRLNSNVEFVKVAYGEVVDIVEKIKPKQWQILPKRWCVERTFAWTNWSRILSKDYEIKTVYEENSFMISHLHTLLRRY